MGESKCVRLHYKCSQMFSHGHPEDPLGNVTFSSYVLSLFFNSNKANPRNNASSAETNAHLNLRNVANQRFSIAIQ